MKLIHSQKQNPNNFIKLEETVEQNFDIWGHFPISPSLGNRELFNVSP
jgi:hypothetical protein